MSDAEANFGSLFMLLTGTASIAIAGWYYLKSRVKIPQSESKYKTKNLEKYVMVVILTSLCYKALTLRERSSLRHRDSALFFDPFQKLYT